MSNDGGPAFPAQESVVSNGDAVPSASGMSLRDYFAAKAMMAWLPADDSHMRAVALAAYKMADAMLAARKAGEK